MIIKEYNKLRLINNVFEDGDITEKKRKKKKIVVLGEICHYVTSAKKNHQENTSVQ